MKCFTVYPEFSFYTSGGFMKKYKKQYPVPAYEDIMMGEAGSANDCTGLIPSVVYYGSEYESYNEICDYSVSGRFKQDMP